MFGTAFWIFIKIYLYYGGTFLQSLNILLKPIAKKYCEGNLKRKPRGLLNSTWDLVEGKRNWIK